MKPCDYILDVIGAICVVLLPFVLLWVAYGLGFI